jgi:DNA-binding MarR family transcriptional regulator
MGEKMDDESDPTLVNDFPETDFVGTLFEDIRFTVKTILPAIQQCMGVSLVEFLFFSQLFNAKELSQAELQKRLGVDGAVVTRLVKQLEREGLITRRADPTDNRFTLVTLTERAYRLAEDRLGRRQKLQTSLMDGINREDVECMKGVLAHMRQNAKSILAAEDMVKK